MVLCNLKDRSFEYFSATFIDLSDQDWCLNSRINIIGNRYCYVFRWWQSTSVSCNNRHRIAIRSGSVKCRCAAYKIKLSKFINYKIIIGIIAQTPNYWWCVIRSKVCNCFTISFSNGEWCLQCIWITTCHHTSNDGCNLISICNSYGKFLIGEIRRGISCSDGDVIYIISTTISSIFIIRDIGLLKRKLACCRIDLKESLINPTRDGPSYGFVRSERVKGIARIFNDRSRRVCNEWCRIIYIIYSNRYNLSCFNWWLQGTTRFSGFNSYWISIIGNSSRNILRVFEIRGYSKSQRARRGINTK